MKRNFYVNILESMANKRIKGLAVKTEDMGSFMSCLAERNDSELFEVQCKSDGSAMVKYTGNLKGVTVFRNGIKAS